MSKQVYIMIPRSVNKTDILRTIDESKYFHYCECIPQDKQDAQIYNIYSDEEVCAIGAPSSVFMTGEKLTQTLKQSDILRNHYSSL